MNQHQLDVLNALQAKRFVKVIAGIANLDADRVSMVVKAATAAGATAVDVAAHPDIVKQTRELTDLPVFASSVVPAELAEAVALGADVAEIGNFDGLYENGFYLTAEDVIRLTEETLALLPEGTPVSVTVPGFMTQEAQVQLARQLEALGVAMLQTEGASRVISTTKEVQLLTAEEKLARTLENTWALVSAVSIPVMTASGIDATNVTEAFRFGAAAVGIGSAVNRLASEAEMHAEVAEIMAQVNAKPVSAAFEIAS